MRRHLVVFATKQDLENMAQQMLDYGATFRRASQQIVWGSGLVEDFRVIRTTEDCYKLAGHQYSAVIYCYTEKDIPSFVVNYLSSLIREPAHASL